MNLHKKALNKSFYKNFRALKLTLTKLVNRVFDQRLRFNEASGFFPRIFLAMNIRTMRCDFILDRIEISRAFFL